MAERKINFTKATIEALPAPEPGKRAEYQDTKTPHLFVRVYPTGKKVFQVYRRMKNHVAPVRIAICAWPELSLDEIRRSALQINAELARGENPNAKREQERRELAFAELFEIYMERHSKPKKKTWREDEAYFNRHLNPAFGKKRVSDIAKKDISALHARIGKSRPIHANRVLALVSSVFNKAINEFGLLTGGNPCAGIKKFPERHRDRFLSQEELTRFFDALEAESPCTRDFFLMALFTGARRGNVLAMRWIDLDFTEQVWRIPGENYKNGEPMRITLRQEALNILRERRQEAASPFVFPGPGRTGHYVEPRKAWQRICERAGFENTRIHDLRHTMGTWLAKTGASLPVIKKALGHKSTESTLRYINLDLDPVSAAVDAAMSAMRTKENGAGDSDFLARKKTGAKLVKIATAI